MRTAVRPQAMRIVVTLAALLAGAVPASAGPEGAYDMTGTNPGDRSPYTGTILVERTGETYAVTWRFGSDETQGVGVLAAGAGDTFAVSYGTPSGHGIALYTRQPDGSWSGAWANGGGKALGSEVWRPRASGTATRGAIPANDAAPQDMGAVRP